MKILLVAWLLTMVTPAILTIAASNWYEYAIRVIAFSSFAVPDCGYRADSLPVARPPAHDAPPVGRGAC